MFGKVPLHMVPPDVFTVDRTAAAVPKEPVEIRRAVLFLRSRGRRSQMPRQHLHDSSGEPAVFFPEELSIILSAFDEACAFCRKSGAVSPALRNKLASVIVYHAKRGLYDSHRLALKAIIA